MQRQQQPEAILKENMLEAQVIAALGGHELGSWEEAGEPDKLEYQAICKNCGQSVYVNSKVFYSILDPTCPSQQPDNDT